MRAVSCLLLSLLILVLAPSNAHAEYTRVALKIFGMDCAICAHGVRVAIQKVDGVESVELSLERAEADIRLRQDNRVSLDQFRKIVKSNGFEPRQATVTVVGTPREVSGKLAFEVSGLTTPLVVVSDRSDAAAFRQLKNALDSKTPAVFEITGSVEKKSDGVEQIAVASVNRRP
jgi:copper chaperone CopZ